MKLHKRLAAAVMAVVMSAVTMQGGIVAFAAEAEKPPTLTVEQATANAIAESSEIKSLEEQNELADDSIARAKDKMWETIDYSTILSLSTQIMQQEASQANNSQNALVKRESLKNSITTFFAAVIAAENALELYDQNLKIQQKQLAIANVNKSLGNISEVAYGELKNNYDKAVSERAAKNLEIDNAYASLNQIMNRKLSNRYTLVLDLKYTPLGTVNTQTLAASAISQNANIKKLADDIRIAEYKLQVYSPETDIYGREVVSGSDSKASLEINLEQAHRAMDTAKSNLEKNAQALANKVASQELQYKSLAVDLENMKKQLTVKEKQYELGKITELTLITYQYEIATKEEALRSLVDQHALNVMIVKNPALL